MILKEKEDNHINKKLHNNYLKELKLNYKTLNKKENN